MKNYESMNNIQNNENSTLLYNNPVFHESYTFVMFKLFTCRLREMVNNFGRMASFKKKIF